MLSAQEAIGNPEKYDFPLLNGKEKIVEAEFEGCHGHAFTDMYGGFEGSLKEVFNMELTNNYRRALQVATINALANYWGLVKNTIHCKDSRPLLCAEQSVDYIVRTYPRVSRIAFIGFQPALIDLFSKKFVLKILDLDKDNIGQKKFGNIILDGNEYLQDAVEWSQLVLSTGSTLVNNTIDDILNFCDKSKIVFYGVTISGASKILGLNRICFDK